MLRIAVYSCFFLSFALAVTTFALKEKVDMTKKELMRTQRQIVETQQTLHILQAEWAHLNQPAYLQSIVKNHLSLNRTSGKQMQRWADARAQKPATVAALETATTGWARQRN